MSQPSGRRYGQQRRTRRQGETSDIRGMQMDKRTFVDAIRVAVQDAAVVGTISMLRGPPGRKPEEDSLVLSAWFNGLSFRDRQKVELVIQQTAEAAVFGFLCVLDGVRAIENGLVKGELDLRYRQGAVDVRLNDTSGDELHDLL